MVVKSIGKKYGLLKQLAGTLLLLLSFHGGMAQVFFNSTHIPVWHTQFEQPALAGTDDGIRTFLSYRYQWTGLEGAPMTIYTGADMKLPIKNLSGGVFLAHDRAGAINLTSGEISIAYSVPLKKGQVNIGAKTGIKSMSLNGGKLKAPTAGEDFLISTLKQTSLRPNLNFGISYIHDILQVGAFVDNIADFKTKLSGVHSDFKTDFGRYYGVHIAANIPLNENVNIEPSVFLRINSYNYQIDYSLSTTVLERYTFGIGARGYNNNSFESLIMRAKVRVFEKLMLMYSYDIMMSTIRLVNKGSHEASLYYLIPSKTGGKRVKVLNHPRYL